MEFYAEMKLAGDEYAGGFSCGLTMTGSKTIKGFTPISETPEKTQYQNERGNILTVHKKKDGAALRTWSTVHNGSQEEITLEMLASFVLTNVEADKIHRLQSFWSAEGKLRTETIEDLHLEKSWSGAGVRIEKFGNVGSMPVRKYFPFLALENTSTGKFLGIQLYCASSWQMEILCSESQQLTVTGGLADRDFGHWMKKLTPGEHFRSPEAVIAEGNSLYEICDKLVKAQHPQISPADEDMGIVFNEFCTTWGNPSLKNIQKICDKIAGKGIRYLVIDCGWYGGAKDWYRNIGDWEVNQETFPGGLKQAADYIRSKGMIPGLWFEAENVADQSKSYQNTAHLVKKDGLPLTVGQRGFWDMEDPWVTDYLDQKVIRTLKDCGFGYVKIDYNETMGMGCDGGDSLGESLYRKIAASQKFFQRIRQEIPNIVIENCSSGGHRLEPSMMELVSQASFSDAHETLSIPLIAANLHAVIRPDQSQIWAVIRANDSEERIYYSMISTFLGRMCLSGDICDLSEKQWQLIQEGIRFYQKAADIIKHGVTIQRTCSTESYNHPQGEQLVIRQWNSRRLIILHRFEHSHNIQPAFPSSAKIISEYGRADRDFSAKAWIYELPSASFLPSF